MNEIRRSVLVLLLCAAGVAASGVRAEVTEIELTRAVIQAERQAIVAATMELTEDEALRFWPAYREYRAEMARVEDRMVKMLTEFVGAQPTLADEQALRLLDEYLDIEAAAIRVRKKHAGKMRPLLPPAKVARFFQIENKLDAVVRSELAAGIPLAR